MSDDLKNILGINENQPNDWFETLYANSNENGNGVPWANMDTHPVLKAWLSNNKIDSKGKTALVIGCGLGDDAITLEKLGFDVTAFDVSKSAIDLCNKRFPKSNCKFVTADLLAGIPDWSQKFDFVLEIFTLQALPPKYESQLFKNTADLVAPKGMLFVITEIQLTKRVYENGPPWLLNANYIEAFKDLGFSIHYHTNKFEPTMGDEIHLTIFSKNTP